MLRMEHASPPTPGWRLSSCTVQPLCSEPREGRSLSVAQVSNLRRRLEQVISIPTRKVYLAQIPIGSNIVNALPPDYDRAAWRRQLGLPEDALALCYFGFLNSSKGGEELVEALDNLAQRGYNVALVMIGGAVGPAIPPTGPTWIRWRNRSGRGAWRRA